MTEVLRSFRNIENSLRKVLDTDQPTVCASEVRHVLVQVSAQREMAELGLFDIESTQ